MSFPCLLRAAIGRLEQFDEVAGRVLNENLSTAGPAHDVVAEAHSFGFESRDLAVEIIGHQLPPAVSASPNVQGPQSGAWSFSSMNTVGFCPQT